MWEVRGTKKWRGLPNLWLRHLSGMISQGREHRKRSDVKRKRMSSGLNVLFEEPVR